MRILGIDPSISSGTGLALVSFAGDAPDVLQSLCIKDPGSDLDDALRVRLVACQVAKLAADWKPDLFAIEEPPRRVRAVSFKRSDGSPGARALVSPMQWRLIGQIEMAAWFLGVDRELVSVDEAKRAVGAKPRSGGKPVDEVMELLGPGIELSPVKYVREAVVDAIAVAIAAQSSRVVA